MQGVKKITVLTAKIFTGLSKKKSISGLSRELGKSRQTIINHVKTLLKQGLITKQKNPTKQGREFFTKFSYTHNDEKNKNNNSKVHVHKLQVYCKVVNAPKKWSKNREFIRSVGKFKD